jgi:hypothetical protein
MYTHSASLASLTGSAPAGAHPANGKPFVGSAPPVARLNTTPCRSRRKTERQTAAKNNLDNKFKKIYKRR